MPCMLSVACCTPDVLLHAIWMLFGFPEWVSGIYKIVAFFNLDTQGVVPRECMASAFFMPWLTLGATGALLFVQGVIFGMFKRKARAPLARRRRL